MKTCETPLPGVFVLEPERVVDERGFFARTFDAADFAARGIATGIAQCSISYNERRGTLRGMHWADGEEKFVRCTAGAVWDVALDLRIDTPRWFAVELSAENRKQLYLPRGVAHGFITLVDGAELFYQITAPYRADTQHGVRWNDPAFAIDWPLTPTVISRRDQEFPDYSR
jgi:dTDP-4-dehydrorhamnose 3,5-epimerase